MEIKACIFDLDGVIVDTAKYHYQAWRKLANQLGFDITLTQNEELKGVSRMGSLDIILQWGGVELSAAEKQQLATQKNEWYLSYIQSLGPDNLLPGAREFVAHIKTIGLQTALGSASKNAQPILKNTEATSLFEAIIDGTKVSKAKPHPETFLKAAEALGVAPAHCVVFEDAPKGIQAALRAGMYAVGIGEAAVLAEAHTVLKSLGEANWESILALLAQGRVSLQDKKEDLL